MRIRASSATSGANETFGIYVLTSAGEAEAIARAASFSRLRTAAMGRNRLLRHASWLGVDRGHAGAQRCGGPASVAAKPRNFDMFCASRYQLATLSRNIFTSARRLAATFATASEA